MDIHQSLINKCKDGDLQAFGLLIPKVEQYLYRICYYYINDSEEALDILQEVYLKIFRFINQYDSNRPFLPWAKQVAVRTCLNYHRSKRRHQYISLDAVNEDGLCLMDQLADEDTINWETRMEERQVLEICLQGLPDNYRIAVFLFYMEQMSYQEIAEVLDKPVGTVKSDLFRARRILLKLLDQAGWMEA